MKGKKNIRAVYTLESHCMPVLSYKNTEHRNVQQKKMFLWRLQMKDRTSKIDKGGSITGSMHAKISVD